MKLALWLFVSNAVLGATSENPWAEKLGIDPTRLKGAQTTRDVLSSARLESENYRFYVVFFTPESLSRTKSILTHYAIYEKMIPFVKVSTWSPSLSTLKMVGGIWNYEMTSLLKLVERPEEATELEILQGHFLGLKARLQFFKEQGGRGGTWVYFGGGHSQKAWPPKLVMEEGAKIALEFTGKKMRGLIESSDASNSGVVLEPKKGLKR